MAITLKRKGNDISNGVAKYPHDRLYEAYYIAESNQVANYLDFKYVFKIYTDNGLIATYETSPGANNYGVLDVNKYIKNLLQDIKYTGTNGYYKACQEYRVSVQEFYSNTLQGSETYFNKGQLSERVDNYNFSQYPISYKDLGTTPLILTNAHGKTLRQNKTTTAYLTALNQYMTYVTFNITYANGYIWQFRYNFTGTYSFSAGSSTIDDGLESGEFIPIGYTDLITNTFTTVGYWDTSDVWHASVAVVTGILDVSFVTIANSIEIWSPFDNTTTSKWTFNECDNKTITVHWLNQKGGFEFMNLNKDRTDTLEPTSDEYNTNNVDSLLFNDKSLPNKRKFDTKKDYFFELHSDYLTDDEIEYMSTLWYSDKIYLDIDGSQVPVIIKGNEREVYIEDKRLYQYTIKFEYAVN